MQEHTACRWKPINIGAGNNDTHSASLERCVLLFHALFIYLNQPTGR